MKKIILILFFLVLGYSGCSSGTQYLDPERAQGSMYWGPYEIKRTVKKMTESMHNYLKYEYKKPVFIEVKTISNQSSEEIDIKLMTGPIEENLLKHKIFFIDNTLSKERKKEIKLIMVGWTDPDSDIAPYDLKSPNFYLIGNIADNVRTADNHRVQYIVVTLKLVQVENMKVLWQDRKEFLKSTEN